MEWPTWWKGKVGGFTVGSNAAGFARTQACHLRNGRTTPGIVPLVWSIIVTLMDDFVRPILIRRGVDLPRLLILAGVIGGLLLFGVIGLFIGPVLLAVTYSLVAEWVTRDPAAPESSQPATAHAEPAVPSRSGA